MERITYTNSDDYSLLLEKPYIITNISGLGVASVDTQLEKAAFQDGETYLDSILNPIDFSLEMIITGDSEEDLFNKRKNIIKLFNPKKGKGTMLYEYSSSEKAIECVVSRPPVFVYGQTNHGEKFQRVLIQLTAPAPFWLDNFVSGETLSFSVPLVQFDNFQITDTFEYESAGTNRTNLFNSGDVETPVKIVFNGPAVNPIITNETTGEFIKVTQNLGSGESLTITTDFGNKTVIYNDGTTDSNAFGFIDLNSTFWQLQVGDNEVSYTADTGTETAIVNISYTNRFLGV